MKFGEILKRIRLEKKDSFRKLGSEMGVAFTYIDKIERGLSPVSKNFFEKIIEVYRDHKDELISAYCQEVLPEKVLTELEVKLIPAREYLSKRKFKLYTCDSKSSGGLSKKIEYKEMVVPMDFQIDDKGFCIKIENNEYKEFFDGDILLIETTQDNIQMLNKKNIVYKIGEKLYIGKVVIKNYIPYLYCLNSVYEPIMFDEKVKIVGVVSKLIYRELLENNN